MNNPARRPIVQALLIADHIYQDGSSGKIMIAGIFNELTYIPTETIQTETIQNVQDKDGKVTLPLHLVRRAGSPYAYVSLTEVADEQSFLLRYVSLDDHQVIFYSSFTIQSDSPIATHERIIPLPMLPPTEGTFVLELLWHNEEPLGYARIVVSPFSNNVEEQDNDSK